MTQQGHTAAHRSADSLAAAARMGRAGFAGRARDVVRGLWRGLCGQVAAWRRRAMLAVLYAELFELSDAELQRRGIPRGDLHRMVSDAAESE